MSQLVVFHPALLGAYWVVAQTEICILVLFLAPFHHHASLAAIQHICICTTTPHIEQAAFLP